MQMADFPALKTQEGTSYIFREIQADFAYQYDTSKPAGRWLGALP